jgi:hypothetical protein
MTQVWPLAPDRQVRQDFKLRSTTENPACINANLPLHARKVPSAGPAMKGKTGNGGGPIN